MWVGVVLLGLLALGLIGIACNSVLLMLSGGGAFAVFLAVLVVRRRGNKGTKRKKQNAYAVRHPHPEAEGFYRACRAAGLELETQMSAEAAAQARAIAEQNQWMIPKDRILAAYCTGKTDARRAAEQDRLEEKYTNAKRLEKLLPFHGRNKTIKVTQDMLDYYSARLEKLLSGKNSQTEQEKNWALVGGLAGPSAELQRQKGERHTKHTQLMHEKQLWRDAAERVKSLLVDDSEPEKLFDRLSFPRKEVHVIDNGAVLVEASVISPEVRIYDQVRARIDGTITAVVTQNGRPVGEAPMILPCNINNVSTRYKLTGACSGTADPDRPCEVYFKCRDLWAIQC